MTALPTSSATAELGREVARRRTFAIISHPDAGKTTLTEKLLLYGGAIEMAGAVRARKGQRHTTSDWMAIEQSRGISITSTALQFEYRGHCLNLLDTPGHEDFSEDTYRTLAATDSAVMVLDSAKGIEPQTRKLFEVCRMRHIPILCFINKLDHPGRDPFDLVSEIERELHVAAVPMNWPIGNGPTFQGVFDLRKQQVLRFERSSHGASIAPVTVSGLDDPRLDAEIGTSAWNDLREAAELLAGAGHAFDAPEFNRGRMIPVYFGSAINNFGVEPFLEAVLEYAPPPAPRGGVDPTSETFTGFVFKIQANMDKRHRDRLAFMRVCSGMFEKDMLVHHSRLDREVRMTRPHRLFARERETIEVAYPGDADEPPHPLPRLRRRARSPGRPLHRRLGARARPEGKPRRRVSSGVVAAARKSAAPASALPRRNASAATRRRAGRSRRRSRDSRTRARRASRWPRARVDGRRARAESNPPPPDTRSRPA